jgi:hypothetical protein
MLPGVFLKIVSLSSSGLRVQNFEGLDELSMTGFKCKNRENMNYPSLLRRREVKPAFHPFPSGEW